MVNCSSIVKETPVKSNCKERRTKMLILRTSSSIESFIYSTALNVIPY